MSETTLKQAATISTNPAWDRKSQARLSVLIPYFRFDCLKLVQTLLDQANKLPDQIELLLADDGSQNADFNKRLKAVIEKSNIAVHWQVFAENQGRSVIRNQLITCATASHVLFLDCDMLPDSDDFLSTYLRALEKYPEALALVGGRSYLKIRHVETDKRLYHYFSQRTECLPAEQRQRHAAWYVFTNNILIRRALLLEQPFDDSFSGWGFEDTDWGLRISHVGAIYHLDNTATHLGLMRDQDLFAKYCESVHNFRRILQKHPDEVRTFPVTRMAAALARLGSLRIMSKRLARVLAANTLLPLKIRLAALQLFRASLYAEAFTGDSNRTSGSS